MLGRAVAVSMLPPVVFTSLPPSWFSASPPVGLNFFHPVLGRQSWQVLKAVFLVFPPVPGMSWTTDSGRLWGLRLARRGTMGSNLGDGWFDDRVVSIQFWSVGWCSKRKTMLLPTASMQHRSQFQEPVWIWLRSVYFPNWSHWVFTAAKFPFPRSCSHSLLGILVYLLWRAPHAPGMWDCCEHRGSARKGVWNG